MRSDQLKRFLDTDVVGQLTNGLFFEGQIVDKEGKTLVLDRDNQAHRQISPSQVRWLAKAERYC
jgi:hypothetical protein